MEENVLKIIAKLYEHFNGDPVEIDRAFRCDYKSMQEQDIEYTKNIYKQYDVDSESIREFLQALNEERKTKYLARDFDLDIEDLVWAHIYGLTIREYMGEGHLGSKYWGETDFFKRNRRDKTGRAKCEPINELTVEWIIEELRMYYNADGIKSLLEKGYAVISDEQQRKNVMDVFGLVYWATPSQVNQWLIENDLSVEEMIEILDKRITVEEYKRTTKDDIQNPVDETKDDIQIPVDESLALQLLGELFEKLWETTDIYREHNITLKQAETFLRWRDEKGLNLRDTNALFYAEDNDLIRNGISPEDKLCYCEHAVELWTQTERNYSYASLVLKFGVEVLTQDVISRHVAKKYLQGIELVFKRYGVMPRQIKQWLIENDLSIIDVKEILNTEMTVEKYKREREETRKKQESIHDQEIRQLEKDLRTKIQELVIKLLNYYVQREKDILNGEEDEGLDAIDLVEYALSSDWEDWEDFEEDEKQAVQKMYEDCGVTREEVSKYCYKLFDLWEADLIQYVTRGMSLDEFWSEEDEFWSEDKETISYAYLREDKWRKFVKVIYSATSSNIEMQEIKGFEKVYNQLLAVKKEMQQRGVIEKDVGTKIQELVIKLLDYFVPREKDILNGEEDEELDAIDLVQYALCPDWGIFGDWKGLGKDEEQAVQKMYEDCGVTREEVLKYYYNCKLFDGWEPLIEYASRGMSLDELWCEEYELFSKDEGISLYAYLRYEQWRKFVKVIYSATSSNIEMQEIKEFEKVYNQLLAVKKEMQQRGVIEKDVGTKIQELVIKLLDYYVPRGKDILNGEEEGEYKRHAIECVVAALEYGEEYFEGDEAQAVQGMYESCGVTPDEITQYLLDNGIDDEFILIDIVSRGMSLAEFKDVQKTHSEEQTLMDILRTTYEKISEGRKGISDMDEINRIYQQCFHYLEAMEEI